MISTCAGRKEAVVRDSLHAQIEFEAFTHSVVGYVIMFNNKQTVNDGGVKRKGSQVILVTLTTDSLTFFLDWVPHIIFRREK